ncbi:MAG: zinc-binding dehydrogenase [Candidatus Bathyarchaeia archaeon]|nr:zinc-binding dehydrogenase [Candidatus Bathyarchaeota archaeon]
MKAIRVYKDNAEIIDMEIEKPRRNEVLVETKACGICMSEVYMFTGKLPGGRVAGHEGVGVIAALGEDVVGVDIGDRVTTLGGPAFAEYYKTSIHNIEKIPSYVNDEDIVYWISEPLACVVNAIKGSKLKAGDDVCVIGCGYMGLLIIQALPKSILGELIAVDIREDRLRLAEKFGADHILDARKADIVSEVHRILGGYVDVVIEASGAKGTIHTATELLRPGGKLILFGWHVEDEIVPTSLWHTKGLVILNTSPAFSLDFNRDFHDAVKLLKKGVFDQSLLITHRFHYTEAQKAFKIALEKPEGFIKAVITF